MKNLMFCLLALSLAACSSGSSGDKKGNGNNTVNANEFRQASVGQWASNCQDAGDGRSYVDLMTIQGDGNGSNTFLIYGVANCQGEMQGQQQRAFTYEVTGTEGSSIKINITVEGQTTAATAKIEGGLMTITANGNATVYRKQ